MFKFQKSVLQAVIFFALLFSFSALVKGDIYSYNDLEKEQIAREYLNEGDYLVEVGKYLDALENYDAAFEISSYSRIIAEALLAKANLLSIYLDSEEIGLNIYQNIEEHYPDSKVVETAIYRQGFLLFQMNRFDESKQVFNRYLKHFPKGEFRESAETLLNISIMRESAQKTVKEPVKKPVERPYKKPVEKPVKRPDKEPVKKPGKEPFKKPVKVDFLEAVPEIRIKLCSAGKIRLKSISGSPICTGELCRRSFKITASNNSLKLDGKTVQRWEIIFDSDSPLQIISGGYKKKVRGKIKLRLKKGKQTTINAINVLNIESYLRSVVPMESKASWHMETLKAQAVAARTYAYYRIRHRKGMAYDVLDDERSQVYGGFEREKKKTDQAVRETKGIIMTYNNRPILAEYSSNSGGYTADVKSLFNINTHPYLSGKEDPLSLKATDGTASWSKQFDKSRLESALRNAGIRCRGVNDIFAVKLGPSGRIMKIRCNCKNGSGVINSTKNTRRFLCSKRGLKLREILVKIRKTKKAFVFDGHGWGHGRGLSQWGACFMGEEGKTYGEILKFYYSNVDIVEKW